MLASIMTFTIDKQLDIINLYFFTVQPFNKSCNYTYMKKLGDFFPNGLISALKKQHQHCFRVRK